ncbi:MAG: DUF1116 domain-containing protein [Chloroflexota bacterium]
MTHLLPGGVHAINVGVAEFALAPRTAGAQVTQLDWRPPAEGDRELGLLLARLEDDPSDQHGKLVKEANARALERLLAAKPTLIEIAPAAQAIPALSERRLLHAGPPIEWDRMCGPMRGALIGAALFEGWATDPADASSLLASGTIALEPCHHHGAVGPMAGVISPSMPVVVVENSAQRNRAYSNLNEGLGAVLRFGAFGPEVLERLRWQRDVLGPALASTIARSGPIDLGAITAQALQMGDECHNRNVAATSLLTRLLAPAVVRSTPPDTAAAILDCLGGNNHFYLNLSMAACKSALDAAHGIPGSTLVTAMARNGVDFGIRVSGTGDRWFTAPSTVPDGLYFPGYGPADANPDLGDSAITETFGIGGFAMAGAPAIVRFVGGTPADAAEHTRQMGRITLGSNPNYQIPSLDFTGTPTGIDLRRVLDTGVAPVINTGIAHREAGIGQIGAGIARAPMACFAQALVAIGNSLGLHVPGGDS